jgi:hypothetical protein
MGCLESCQKQNDMAHVEPIPLDVYSASLTRPVAIAYGRNVVAGNVIMRDLSTGDQGIVFMGLGEGPWEAVEELYINGQQIDLADSTIVHFHRGLDGEASTHTEGGIVQPLYPDGFGSLFPYDTEGDQRVDIFTPEGIQGLTFSRTAYVAIRIPTNPIAPPTDLAVQGIYKCRRVNIYDSAGTLIDTAYSENPIWHTVDLLEVFRKIPHAMFDWASVVAAASFCDALIPIGGVNVPRFVSHVAFPNEVDLATAVNSILITCRGRILEADGKIFIRVDQARSSVFAFNMSNTLENSFSTSWDDTTVIPNRIEASFRDLDNNFTPMIIPFNHEVQQARLGRVIVDRIELDSMPAQQAERLALYRLARDLDYNLRCKLSGNYKSFTVLPGDVVSVSNDVDSWAGTKDFEVTEITENPDGSRDFELKEYNAAVFIDDAGDGQPLIDTNLGLLLSDPPSWSLSANLNGDLRLSLAIPEKTNYTKGTLFILIDRDTERVYNGGTATIGFSFLDGDILAADTQITLNDSSAFIVGAYLTVGIEIMKIEGPGSPGAPPTSNTIDVSRGQLGTVAADKADLSTVRSLRFESLSFSLPEGYSLENPTLDLANGPYYVTNFRPGRMTILYASLIMSSGRRVAAGTSKTFAQFGFEGPIVAGMLPGMRVSRGDGTSIQIPGPLRLGTDLTLPRIFGSGDCMGPLYATVETPPTGADIIIRFFMSDVLWEDALFGPIVQVECIIPAGSGGSGVFVSGAYLGNVGGKWLTVDVVQVGSTEPGRDFTLFIPR